MHAAPRPLEACAALRLRARHAVGGGHCAGIRVGYPTLRHAGRGRAQSEYGDLYKVSLVFAGEAVSEVKVKYFDTIPPCASVCILKSGFLFAASEFGNHALYQFQARACPPTNGPPLLRQIGTPRPSAAGLMRCDSVPPALGAHRHALGLRAPEAPAPQQEC